MNKRKSLLERIPNLEQNKGGESMTTTAKKNNLVKENVSQLIERKKLRNTVGRQTHYRKVAVSSKLVNKVQNQLIKEELIEEILRKKLNENKPFLTGKELKEELLKLGEVTKFKANTGYKDDRFDISTKLYAANNKIIRYKMGESRNAEIIFSLPQFKDELKRKLSKGFVQEVIIK